MAFGTYTIDFEGVMEDGGKVVCGHVSIEAADTAFTTDLSAYFAKAIKWAQTYTVGAEKDTAAIDITTTPTTLAATISALGVAGTIYYIAVGY